MPQFLDATVAPAPASSQAAPMGAFARAASENPADWWAPKLPTHSSGPANERQSSRQSPQVSWSPHTTPTSPMNHSREMSQLSMFRLGSETEVDQASSCGGDLGPCTSDGMPTSAPSSAFNLGPIAQPKPAPAGVQTHDSGLSVQHTAAPAEAESSSHAEIAPLFLPLPQPQDAPVPLGETLVGLSTVVLDGESGVHQKASLDSSGSVWSPLLTTGVAALQTTGGASSGRGNPAAPPRLLAAPSLQSWAGSLEGHAALAGLASTYSSPVAAGREAETAPSSPAVQLGDIMAAGRDTEAMVQGGSVSLSVLAQGTSMQSSPQLPMSSREGTPTGASPGKSWGGPEAARPGFWEPQSLEARPTSSLPAADLSSASGKEAAVDVLPGQGHRQASKSLDRGQYLHDRDSWAAAYTGSDKRSGAGAVCGPSGAMQDTVTGASICALLREEQKREATRDSSEPAGMASRQSSRPALRERTDSAVYHRATYDGAPTESTCHQEACVSPEPSSPQGAARECSGELGKGHSGGCLSGAAGLGGIQEEPARRGGSREGEPDAVVHVLRANLSSSEVQLSRRARNMLESGPAPGSLLTQAGIGGYKTAAPATGSAPASGDLRKSSLWDDSARTSCAHTDADCADKAWPGLGLSSAPNSGGVLRSFASAHDGSRVERELSSPYPSSAFPQGEGVPGGVLTGQQSTEPARAPQDSLEQRSSTERQRRAIAAESGTDTGGRSEARQPAPGPAMVREAAARERAEVSGGRTRRGVESSALSSGSGGPRLTEALLAELEAHHKLQARKEKLVDVHERTRAWLAAAELPLETEGRAKKLAAARIKSFKGSDSANLRSSSFPIKAANKKAEPGKQKTQGGLVQWFSCFAGGGVK